MENDYALASVCSAEPHSHGAVSASPIFFWCLSVKTTKPSAEAEDGGLLSLQFVDEVVVSVEGSSHDVCFASWS